MPTPWNAGVHGTPVHGRAGGPHVDAWAYDTATAAAAMASSRPIFLNFVTFTTQHRSTSVLICWGHAMYTPTLIASREAVFNFFRKKLGAY